jgi:putative ABC transport system permease protein
MATLRVIGVVEDFHYHSLHERIYPYIFILKDPDTRWGYISVRINNENTQQTLREIESLWDRFTTNDPMVWFFMEEDFNNLYVEDKRSGILSGMFAVLTIIIGTMGLFGLASYTTRARTKEIGIRKVNGAGTMDIVLMLYKNISVLIGVSTLLAWVGGYYFTTRWLQSFYFRTDLSAWEFAGSLICVSAVSILTISWQSYRAAIANPAETLKYE